MVNPINHSAEPEQASAQVRCVLSEQTATDFAQAFAFLGNSLLAPMSQTSAVGLDPAFWEAFPDFGDEGVSQALANLSRWAQGLADPAAHDAQQLDSVTAVSVEFTHLFIGPPKPAAYPWETFYRGDEVTSGFGRPTFEMREALQEAGLQLDNENNQYEDHMGIELLLLSVYCSQIAGQLAQGEDPSAAMVVAQDFIKAHPGTWIDAFQASVHQECPDGYFDHVLMLAKALLVAFSNE